jgi:hypothetical protein
MFLRLVLYLASDNMQKENPTLLGPLGEVGNGKRASL